MSEEKTLKEIISRECWDCVNKQENTWTHHIACTDPDANMLGNKHGIQNGWFFYPLLFDPVWKESLCKNFKSKSTAVSGAISDAVSGQMNA